MRLKLVIASIVLKAFDIGTTFLAVRKIGKDVEANPIMRYALLNLGNWAYVLNFSVFLLAIMTLYKKGTKLPSLVIIGILMLGVVINNLIACHRAGIF